MEIIGTYIIEILEGLNELILLKYLDESGTYKRSKMLASIVIIKYFYITQR